MKSNDSDKTSGDLKIKTLPKKAAAAAKTSLSALPQKSIASFFKKAGAGKPELDSTNDPGRLLLEAIRYGETKVLERLQNECELQSPSPLKDSKPIVATSCTNTNHLEPPTTAVGNHVHVLLARKKTTNASMLSTEHSIQEEPITHTNMEVTTAHHTEDYTSLKRSSVEHITIQEEEEEEEGKNEENKEDHLEDRPISILQPRSKKKKMTDTATSPFIPENDFNKGTVVLVSTDQDMDPAVVQTTTTRTNEPVQMVVDLSHEPSSLIPNNTLHAQDIQILQSQYALLSSKYTAKLEDLVQRVVQGWMEEEKGPTDMVDRDEMEEECSVLETIAKASSSDTTMQFKDEWLPELAVHVQGR